MTTARPPVDEDLVRRHTGPARAQAILREMYGIEATARPLPGEYDDNFHAVDGAGRQFVLKLMHPGREAGLIDMQCRALAHIAARDPGLGVPRVCPTRTGDLYGSTADEEGATRLVWLLGYLDATPLVDARPKTPEVFGSVGRLVAGVDAALADFSHPAAQREFKWNSSNAGWIRDALGAIADPARRAQVARWLAVYDERIVPAMPVLPHSVIHGDANDHNLLVRATRAAMPQAAGLIDFGDMHVGMTVSGVAIAIAYAILGESDPLAVIGQVLAGYHAVRPLDEAEVEAVYPLIAMRLCVSVVNSAQRAALAATDAYVTISEAPAWEALARLEVIPLPLAIAALRTACGYPALPDQAKRLAGIRVQRAGCAPIVAGTERGHYLDLSVGSALTGADPARLTEAELTRLIDAELSRVGAPVGIGRYDEARLLYTAAAFDSSGSDSLRRRVHLGIDLFAPAGTAVCAPLDGIVEAFANNNQPQDYGPVVVLRHLTDAGDPYFTIYGHLSAASLKDLRVGAKVPRGASFARIGVAAENGGWTPHVHFQVALDLLGLGTDFPGVGRADQRALWRGLCPDPANLVVLPADRDAADDQSTAGLVARRRACLGGNLSVSYRDPLHIVRGWRQYLYDADGRAYLDCYNNVPLVGHSHPTVVRAVQGQMGILNTNTRYLHRNILRYAERLGALLPGDLKVCYFLSSASEANEFALRLARTYTGNEDIIVLEHAYHGHTNTLIDISPYKFDGPGGKGRKPWVHVAPIADDYRGAYRRGDPQAGAKYARHVGELIAGGVKPAAYIAESLPSVGGQIVFPPGYLQGVYREMRAAGGLCIADEVQVGFGRLGASWWGFETQGVVPDIVVFGKPIGNAFPLAAVVTTPAIARAFDNGMEFFATFGGNPVACAAGLAVLDVLQAEDLPGNARRVGGHLLARLEELRRFDLVGDVRGMGLFLGVELVSDRERLTPATDEASYVVNRLRHLGILTGVDGPHHNVIKIRPPLCATVEDADRFADALQSIFSEEGLRSAPNRGGG